MSGSDSSILLGRKREEKMNDFIFILSEMNLRCLRLNVSVKLKIL